jgi:predicted component of type VI protein secretion system
MASGAPVSGVLAGGEGRGGKGSVQRNLQGLLNTTEGDVLEEW